MMRDDDKFLEIMVLYAQTGNLSEVARVLKNRGPEHEVPYSTVLRAYHENEKEFEKKRKESLEERFKLKIKTSNMYEILLVQVQEILDDIKPDLRVKDKEGKKKINTQALHGFRNMMRDAISLLKVLEKQGKNKDLKSDKLVDVLMRHHIIGPLLVEHWHEIDAAVEKEMKKSRGK